MQTQEMIEMYRNGASLKAIAAQSGKSSVKVLADMKEFLFQESFKDRTEKIKQNLLLAIEQNPKLSAKKLSEDFELSLPTLYKLLKSLGITLNSERVTNFHLTPERAKEISSLYVDGFSVEKIAFKTDISPSTIRSFLKKANLIQSRHLTETEIQQVRSLRTQGLSHFQIAKRINRSLTTVARILKDEAMECTISSNS